MTQAICFNKPIRGIFYILTGFVNNILVFIVILAHINENDQIFLIDSVQIVSSSCIKHIESYWLHWQVHWNDCSSNWKKCAFKPFQSKYINIEI